MGRAPVLDAARGRGGGGRGGPPRQDHGHLHQGLNSIEFQRDFQQGFEQSTLHSVVLNALLKIPLNSLLKFN